MKLAILDDYQGVALECADWHEVEARCEITVFREPFDDPNSLAQRLSDFEIICIMRERTPFPRDLIEQLPKLALLVTSGKKNAAIDIEAARNRGVVVCGTRSPGHATAELAFGLILLLARGLAGEIGSVRDGGWQTGLGRDLHGATLGILGLGRLGSRVARLGQACDMRVSAWSQNLTPALAREQNVEYLPRERFFAESDFISIHLRLSERTRHLVDREAFALMKRDAYLINTSRGPIVDQDALIEVVRTKRIAGAALDVFEQEPLPADHPLRSTPGIVCTPHIGYVTRETYEVFYAGMVETVLAYLRGQPVNVLS